MRRLYIIIRKRAKCQVNGANWKLLIHRLSRRWSASRRHDKHHLATRRRVSRWFERSVLAVWRRYLPATAAGWSLLASDTKCLCKHQAVLKFYRKIINTSFIWNKCIESVKGSGVRCTWFWWYLIANCTNTKNILFAKKLCNFVEPNRLQTAQTSHKSDL